jgi:hypothetical protein
MEFNVHSRYLYLDLGFSEIFIIFFLLQLGFGLHGRVVAGST